MEALINYLDLNSIIGNPYKITAYIISIIGYALFSVASGLKKKNHLLIAQGTANFLCAVAEGMQGLWSGLVQDSINFIRNVFVLKKWMNKVLSIVFICLAVSVGVFVVIFDFKNNGWWNLLPVFATLEYSVVLLIPNVRIPLIKTAIMVSAACWTVYGIGLHFLPTIVFNILSFILCFISLVQYFVNKKAEKEIKDIDPSLTGEIKVIEEATEM